MKVKELLEELLKMNPEDEVNVVQNGKEFSLNNKPVVVVVSK